MGVVFLFILYNKLIIILSYLNFIQALFRHTLLFMTGVYLWEIIYVFPNSAKTNVGNNPRDSFSLSEIIHTLHDDN